MNNLFYKNKILNYKIDILKKIVINCCFTFISSQSTVISNNFFKVFKLESNIRNPLWPSSEILFLKNKKSYCINDSLNQKWEDFDINFILKK